MDTPTRPSISPGPATNPLSAHSTWNSLSSLADLVTPKATNRADFIAECKSGALDGVVVAYRTFDSVSITGLFDEELVNALPSSLVYLAHCGNFFPLPSLGADTDIGMQAPAMTKSPHKPAQRAILRYESPTSLQRSTTQPQT